jgi:4-hydroxybenzoyl-CoA thioesterase
MHMYRYERRLHWSECDPGGIIYVPHYLRWMTEGLNEMILRLGFDPNGLIDDRTRSGLPLLKLSMEFFNAPRLHEVVTHEIAVEKLGTKSLVFRHRVLREQLVLMEATETRVWGTHNLHDPTSLKAIEIPVSVRAALSHS